MRMNLVSRSVVLAAGTMLGTAPASAADWLQFGFDPAHSGNNPVETMLSASATGEFALTALFPIYNVTLPNIADGAPVYLSGVMTANGIRDQLFLETKDGHVLALDAATGATIWSHATKPSPPPAGQDYTTSSPAIDPNRQYVYFYGLDGYVHKYSVATGTETSNGGWPELATRKPDVEKGSSALAIATATNGTTYLYVTNGGYPGDAGDYQGHVTAIDLATGAQNVFNANCSDQAVHFYEAPNTPDCAQVQTAIWARPGVIYSAAKDRIFMATGNGTFDANTGGHDWGDSVFAVNPDGTGSGGNPIDSYTPTNFLNLDNTDADLGSTAPAILPSTLVGYPNLAVQGGKDQKLRLLNLDNLSGSATAGPGHTGGELQLINVPQGGLVFAQPAVWVDPTGTTWVFVATGNGVCGLTLGLSSTLPHKPVLTKVWQNGTGGTSPVVANGVLYYFSGAINALNPKTGALLWSDSSPGGMHWESPIVVNGRVYVTDENGQLWAYALDGIFKDGFE